MTVNTIMVKSSKMPNNGSRKRNHLSKVTSTIVREGRMRPVGVIKAIKPIPFINFSFSLLAVVNTHFALHNVYQHISGEDPKDAATADKLLQTILDMMTED